MRRALEVGCPLEGALGGLRDAFVEDPSVWLPEPARWRGAGRWNVRLSAGPLSRIVVCAVGGPWRVGGERWRAVSWVPAAQADDVLPVGRGLPSLAGELGVVAREGGALLLLRARYGPPAGAVGAVADAAGLHRVAQATAREFVTDVAARLTALAASSSGPGTSRP